MGGCISQKQLANPSKSRIKISSQPNKNSQSSLQQQKYGVRDDKPTKSIFFNHAPLANNEFLYNKFHHDNNRPDQINLQWQVQSIEMHDDRLSVNVLNMVPVKLWAIIGGKEKKNMTGLFIQIQKYVYAQMINVTTVCKNDKSNVYEFKITKKIPQQQKIRIILQSVSDPKQSLSLISTYINTPSNTIKLQKQQLLWNNLAFALQTIYNQDQQSLNQKAKSEFSCVICNQDPPTCILIPCKHMCLCRNCLSSFRKVYKSCPLCKKQFTEIVVYKDVKN